LNALTSVTFSLGLERPDAFRVADMPWITVSVAAFCKGLGRGQPTSAEVRAPKNNAPVSQDRIGTDEQRVWRENLDQEHRSGENDDFDVSPCDLMTSSSRPSSRRQSTTAGKCSRQLELT
jgi:hypothetical protein